MAIVPGAGPNVRAVYMKKIFTSKRTAPEAVGQVSLQTCRVSAQGGVIFHFKFSFVRPSAQTGQYTTTTLTSKESGKFSSSVIICPKRLCFAVLEQGSILGCMYILLCSPSTEPELTCGWRLGKSSDWMCTTQGRSLFNYEESINQYFSGAVAAENFLFSTAKLLPFKTYRASLHCL